MDSFTTLLNDIFDFLRNGFSDVNSQILGIIIALVAAYMMGSWRRWLPITLGATVAHLVIRDLLLPIIQGQQFQLPANLMEKSYWIGDGAHSGGALNLFAGYLVIIAIFFVLKRILLKGAAGAHAH